MKVTSMLGKEIDMAALMAQNPHAIAIGNASMNARGDIIGPGGKILKKREQIAMEYHESNPRAVKSVGLKSLANELFPTPAEAIAAARIQNTPAPAPPAEPVATRKRKLIDDSDTNI